MDATSRPITTPIQLLERSDDELMHLTRLGMSRAFDTLVRRHQTLAARIAARHLGDSTLVYDATQQAFLELYRYLDRYEARGKLKPFLRRIVINQCRMLGRSYALTKRWSDQQLLFQHDVSTMSAMRCMFRRDLESALSKLSEKLRIVVILRYGQDMSLSEIADVLQLPLGTVKRRLFTALEKLRDVWDQL